MLGRRVWITGESTGMGDSGESGEENTSESSESSERSSSSELKLPRELEDVLMGLCDMDMNEGERDFVFEFLRSRRIGIPPLLSYGDIRTEREDEVRGRKKEMEQEKRGDEGETYLDSFKESGVPVILDCIGGAAIK